MGNTDSKLQSVYHSHFQRLATPTNNNDSSNDNDNIIPLFNDNINLSFILSLLFQNNNNKNHGTDDNDNDNDNDNNDNLLNYSVYNKYPIFNQFFLDFYNENNNNDIESFHINKQILTLIINSNYKNYENLLRFVILQFIFYSKSVILINNSNSTKNSNNIPYYCPKKLIQNLLLSIRLLINLLPTYYSYQNDISNNNFLIYDTDFIWDNKSLDNIFNIKNNFTNQQQNLNELLEPNCSLGQLIIENLLNLSFIDGFTVFNDKNKTNQTNNNNNNNNNDKDINLVWENGLFTKNTFLLKQYPRLDLNRVYCLELWLTLFSIDLYKTDNHSDLNSPDNKTSNNFIEFLLKLRSNKLNLLFLSIINLLSIYGNNFKSNLIQNSYYTNNNNYYLLKKIDDSIVPNSKKILLDLKAKLILLGLQFINVILYYITINNIQHSSIEIFLQKFMQREFDFKLLLTSFIKIFKHPIDKCIEIELNPLRFHNDLTSSLSSPSNNVSNSTSTLQAQSYSSSSSSVSSSTSASNQVNRSTSNDSSPIKTNLPDIPDLLIQFMLFIKSFININSNFKKYFIEKFANKFVIFNIYYIKYYSNINCYNSSLIPLCYTLILTLLNEKLTLHKLLQTFTINYYTNKLPNFYKLPNLELSNIESLTYRDFIIIHLSNYNIKLIKQNLIPNNLNFEILYNILPIGNNINNIGLNELPKSAILHSNPNSYSNPSSNDTLSYNAILSLLNLFNKMSIKSYLSSYSNNEIYYVSGSQYFGSIQSLSLPSWKLDQLALMIRTILKFISFHYDESKNLLFLLCKYQNLLFQVKDSLQFIDKILFSNPSKLNDYVFNNLKNIKTLQKIEYMTQLNYKDNIYNSINMSINNANGYSNLSNDPINMEKLSVNHPTSLVFNKITSDTDSKEKTANNDTMLNSDNNNKKKNKILEHSDYNYDLYFENKFIYTIFQTQWPWGLNENHKLKLSKSVSIDTTKSAFWTGHSDFKLLARIIKLIVMEFPEILNTKKNSEFSILMKKLNVFKPKLYEKLKDHLPIYLSHPKFYSGIQFLDNNKICSKWLYKLCWTNIFNANSYYYQFDPELDSVYRFNVGTKPQTIILQNKRLNDVMSINGNTTSRPGSLVSSASPILPTLERWSSNNSTLSRTQSNNSSILSFFTHDNNNSITTANSPTSTSNDGQFEGKKSIHNSSNNKNLNGNNNDANNTNNSYPFSSSTSSSSNFFKFSWSHFHKGNDINGLTIQEESAVANSNHKDMVDDDDEEIQNLHTKTYNYPIDLYKISDDEELLKDNIWVNTKVGLFVLKKDKKEELTFFNVTSSLLKKFKFSNNSNDSDCNENNGVLNNDPSSIKSTPSTTYINNNYNSNDSTPLTRPIRRYF
ncbi:hypothetical protein RI543_002104 [Arxiozyma heterogenica]|uniref:Uncharacterized protein n=1 Tax=Arxiozyma heterogenica TaxID=278026 RepID=A0AAN7WN94_9SACH|nr:hypothetical protein RI543_002104 [Kazachstania heterogenica]